jgi:hypothetical protein
LSDSAELLPSGDAISKLDRRNEKIGGQWLLGCRKRGMSIVYQASSSVVPGEGASLRQYLVLTNRCAPYFLYNCLSEGIEHWKVYSIVEKNVPKMILLHF